MRRGQESDVWPVALLLFAVLVPAAGLLWFTGAAMRNERLATRQKLADAYRFQLSSSQAQLQQYKRRKDHPSVRTSIPFSHVV